jgi:hypothetical protein
MINNVSRAEYYNAIFKTLQLKRNNSDETAVKNANNLLNRLYMLHLKDQGYGKIDAQEFVLQVIFISAYTYHCFLLS